MWRGLSFVVLMISVIIGLCIVRQADPLIVQRARSIAFDTFQQLQPAAFDPALPVRIVDIDEASLAARGQWPWPRNVLADLVDRLNAAGAIAIGFDMVFPEPDRLSPAALANYLPDTANLAELRAALEAQPSNDALFAGAVERAPVVMAFVGSQDGTSTSPPPSVAEIDVRGGNPLPFVLGFSHAVSNLPVLTANAHGSGFINWIAEQDQVIRKLPLLIRIDDRIYPSMAVEALRLAQRVSNDLVVSAGGEDEQAFGARTGIVRLRIGSASIPTDANGQMWIHFSRSDRRRYLSAAGILDGSIPASEISGRIVIIGTSAAGLLDIRATPLESAMPGVEAHAQAIEQMLSGHHLVRPDYATGLEILMVVVIGALLALAVRRAGALVALVLGGVIIGAVIAGCWIGFSRFGLLFDPVYPSFALASVFVLGSAYQHLKAETERNRVRYAFGHYMAPALVAKLAADPSRLVLGGETRNLTLLFADVRGFSRRAEGMDAQALTKFVIALFSPLSKTIIDHQGTIDKYIGDSVMAFWNAPLDQSDHALLACRAALHMLTDISEFNRAQRARPDGTKAANSAVALGIGINSGECCVGNFGSAQRFDYSVLGDPVNLASRFEGLNKIYGVPIVVGEETAKAASVLALIEIDLVTVRGFDNPVRVFALLGNETMLASPAFQQLRATQNALLRALRQRQHDTAVSALARLRVIAPEHGKLWSVYEARLSAPTPPERGQLGQISSDALGTPDRGAAQSHSSPAGL